MEFPIFYRIPESSRYPFGWGKGVYDYGDSKYGGSLYLRKYHYGMVQKKSHETWPDTVASGALDGKAKTLEELIKGYLKASISYYDENESFIMDLYLDLWVLWNSIVFSLIEKQETEGQIYC